MEPAPLDVEDPACDEFYLNTWMKTAQNNTQLFEKVRNLHVYAACTEVHHSFEDIVDVTNVATYMQVFGGKILPTDSVLTYEQLKIYQVSFMEKTITCQAVG